MNMRSNFWWSARRELWENRAIFFAPLIIAGLALFGFLIAAPNHWIGAIRKLPTLEAAKQVGAVAQPYAIVASMVLVVGWFVGIFYALDSLYGERRDRSILFWKSMPVSDTTTVLAKAAIPLAVIPAYTMAVALATQLVMVVLGSVILAASGIGVSDTLWSHLPLGTMTLIMIYGVTIHALWFAPIYAWLILISAWARQSPWLWALLPFFAVFVVEWVATRHSFIAYVLQYRLTGAMGLAFTGAAARGGLITELSQLDPARFFSSPNLWLGLLFAAACLYGAIRLRRLREPI